MNVLVIGGAGFLGANLVRRCLQEPGHRVRVLDSLEEPLHATLDGLKAVMDRIEFIRGDMGDETILAEVLDGQDVIFNCAAQTSHPLSIRDPLYDARINCIGNLKLLEGIRSHAKDAVVVYASSSTVTGKAEAAVIDESHGEKPLDIYSANKGVAEKYYRIYNRTHGLKTVALRFANIYGPFGRGDADLGFVNHFIHLAWTNQTIQVFGRGDQKRNLMYVEDAADILYRAALHPKLFGETFFAVHEEHLAVIDVAREIIRVFGRGSLEHVSWPEIRQKIEISAVRISGQRLRDLTGWRPRYTFEQGLEKTRSILESAEER
jgi:UDP-glucose 4-epimerase